MINILTGSNSFLLRTELHRLVSGFVEQHGDMALERLDAEDAAVTYARLQEALQSLPFLAARKLVVINAASANKQFTDNLKELLKELPETTDLIIVETKLDKRSAYYKLLKGQPGFHDFGELDENGLAKWLVAAAGDRRAELALADARYLVGRVGSNQQTLASEIEKLSISVMPDSGDKPGHINKTVINNLTVASPQSTIFQSLEAAFAGNTARALELYREQRALKVEPQQIIAMLGWQLHVLALVKAAGDRPSEAIAKDSKINPYVVRKTAGIARSLTVARTRTLVSDLLAIDVRLKRESVDADDILLDYLINLAQ